MEEVQGSSRKRVYSPEPNCMLHATFSFKYLNYLLPALRSIRRIGSQHCDDTCKDEDNGTHQNLRLLADMALAKSANGFNFKWSDSLKQKLERGTHVVKFQSTNSDHSNQLDIVSETKDIDAISIPQTQWLNLLLSVSKSSGFLGLESGFDDEYMHCQKRKRKINCVEERDQEVGNRVMILRQILPGGEKMHIHELLPELESYIVCLELQVKNLQSLVGIC